MELVWDGVVIFIGVVLIYWLTYRILVKRVVMKRQSRAQIETDKVVRQALLSYLSADQLPSSSIVIADAWGKGVMVFEYVLPLAKLSATEQRAMAPERLTLLLNQIAAKEGLTSFAGAERVFVVSDWWTHENQLYIDVAYLINAATCRYVADLKKLT